jgi:hypothetical protein
MSKPPSDEVVLPAGMLTTIISTLTTATQQLWRGEGRDRPGYKFAHWPQQAYDLRPPSELDRSFIIVCEYRPRDWKGDTLEWHPDLPGWPRISVRL